MSRQLDRILAHGGARNIALGVASVIIVDGERFLQVLEGSREAVRQVYARIDADPRHKAPTVITRAQTLRQRFEAWSLGIVWPTAVQAALLADVGEEPRQLTKALRFIAEAHRLTLDAQQAVLRDASVSG